MTMDQAYTNRDEGYVCCFWNAPSAGELKALFNKVDVPIERILPVSEHKPSA